MRSGPRNSLTDVAGLSVGHHRVLDAEVRPGSGAATGSTVVLAHGGATAAVDVRGGGPGTRETDLLDPGNTVQQAHAVLLTGGSAYGLAAADGVMRWLEEHGEGIPMDLGPDGPAGGGHVVPIVPGAVIFDLPVGDWAIRPTADFGYRAAAAAGIEFSRGSVGAGTAARAGSLKGGVGTASVVLGGAGGHDAGGHGADGPAAGITVAALIVANPVGAVFDPRTGLPWGAPGSRYRLRPPSVEQLAAANELGPKGTSLNTTIGVVATDAALSKAACRRIATAAHDGLARAVRPAHSPLDGDTIFALATGRFGAVAQVPRLPSAFPADLLLTDAISAAAAVCVERAIVDAVLAAESVAGIPAYSDLLSSAFD